jgi:hypothetical protein
MTITRPLRSILPLAFLLLAATAAADPTPRVEHYAGVQRRMYPREAPELPKATEVVVELVWDAASGTITETVHRRPVGEDRPEYILHTGTYVNVMTHVEGSTFSAQSTEIAGTVTFLGAPWSWDGWTYDLYNPFLSFFRITGTGTVTDEGIALHQEIRVFGALYAVFDSRFDVITPEEYAARVADIDASIP